jgi:hypothetical protein
VVTGSADNGVRLWNAQTGQFLGQAFLHPSRVRALAVSPDQEHLLTAGQDGMVRLWDTATRKPIGPLLRYPGPRGARTLAFFADGKKFLVTGEGTDAVSVWEMPTPVEGTVERLILWAQALSGLEMDATGALHQQDAARRAATRKLLQQAGGPPLRLAAEGALPDRLFVDRSAERPEGE